MPDNFKIQLISAINTFLAAFIPAMGTIIAGGPITWTWAFWGSVGLAAIRVGVKAVINSFLPVRLGGVR